MDDEPCLVYLVGFSSLEAINIALPNLLNNVTLYNSSITLRDLIKQKEPYRYLICPKRGELCKQETTQNLLIGCARKLKKQVYVMLDSIECAQVSLRGAATCMYFSAESCKLFSDRGIMLHLENDTFTYF